MNEYKESKNNESNFIEYDVAIETYTNLILEKFINFNFKYKTCFEEHFRNYKHSEDLSYDVWIKFYENKIILYVITNNYSESYVDRRDIEEHEFLYSKIYNIDPDEIEKTMKDIFLFVYNLKYDYMYSKIIDHIESKETIKTKEQIHLSKMLITHNILENCSVCMEPNTVLTTCNHNLCRECHIKITKNKKHPVCPMCRMCLFCEDYEDY